ncbi:MAG: acc operon protein [Chloroflexota bacterium]
MAISPSERLDAAPDADEDELAAIAAAIRGYLADVAGDAQPSGDISRWSRAGRLEAMGLPVQRRTLTREWGI